MSDVVDVEEDDMGDAWCVAPTEACSFVALAVFPNKEDAERFVALLRKDRKKSNTYDGASPGSTYTIECTAMTEAELAAMGDFDGW